MIYGSARKRKEKRENVMIALCNMSLSDSRRSMNCSFKIKLARHSISIKHLSTEAKRATFFFFISVSTE